jgi:hypothetical protein
MHVSISESSPKRTKSRNAGDRMERNALARDFSSTMTKLMELESTIEVQIRAAVESENNLENVDRLKSRLRIVRGQIEQAERPIFTELTNCVDDDEQD